MHRVELLRYPPDTCQILGFGFMYSNHCTAQYRLSAAFVFSLGTLPELAPASCCTHCYHFPNDAFMQAIVRYTAAIVATT